MVIGRFRAFKYSEKRVEGESAVSGGDAEIQDGEPEGHRPAGGPGYGFARLFPMPGAPKK
jgi:hypothetical protein